MALEVTRGLFTTVGSTTGNIVVSGLSFQPKVVFFFAPRMNTATSTEARFGFGCATSSTNRWCYAGNGTNAQPTGDVSKYFSTTKCTVSNVNTQTAIEIDFVSLNSDGFTVNVTKNVVSATNFQYICLGGSELQANVGSFNLNSSTGNQSITGVGFLPTCVIVGNAIPSTTEGFSAGLNNSLGWASGSSNEFSSAVSSTDGSDPTESASNFSSELVLRCDSAGVKTQEANLLTFDSDGFTVDITTASGTPKFGYCALAGVQAFAGSITENTATGNQSVSGVGFQPRIVLFQSVSRESIPGGGSDDANQMIGVAISSSSRTAVVAHDTDNQATSSSGTRLATTKCISHINSGAATITADADFVSQDSDGFTINMTTVDATARIASFLALTESVAGSGGGGMSSTGLAISQKLMVAIT